MRVAAIDQGTTSTRCLVVDKTGAKLVATNRHGTQYPKSGWVEQNPEELLCNIREVLAHAKNVDAIALANQGESCLAWNAITGQALSPIIVWQDARTASQLQGMSNEAAALSKQVTGLPLDSYFSASKLGWLLTHSPQVAQAHREKCLRLGTTNAFFMQRLTGQFMTDVATASRTGLMDLRLQQWSAQMCELHGVPIECLPPIAPVNHNFGYIDGTPVCASTVDQQAALFGHGCTTLGQSKITFGTGAFFLALAGNTPPSAHHLLPTIAWQLEGHPPVYALEGGVYDAGAALEWAKNAGIFTTLEEISNLEGPSALSKGIVFVPAMSGLAAPHWDRTAAPLFIGMDLATHRYDLVRAILEGIAMLAADLVNCDEQNVSLADNISIDGGLSQNRYFAQFLASACKKTIYVPSMFELTALGLAGISGMDISEMRGTTAKYLPDNSISDKDRQRFSDALRRAKGWRIH